MEKKEAPKSITIDLSKLNDEDREILYAQFLRAQMLVNVIPKIRAAESTVADKIVSSFESKGASVYAECETISDVVNKQDVTILPVGALSTDLHYVNKTTQQQFRVEVKSITQVEPIAVDREIINAEVQHKDRLNEEKDKTQSTWHYTTIDIGNIKNPWPFSNMKELLAVKERYKNNEKSFKEYFLLVAQKRIDKLEFGAVKPSKAIIREAETPVKKMISAAETEQRERAKLPLTPPHASSQSKDAAQQPTEANNTQTDNKPRRPVRAKTALLRKEPEAPPTPITQVFKDTVKQREEIKEKNRDLSPDSHAKRKLLVTEKIKIKSQLFDSPLVLIRTEKRFIAHFKGEKPSDHPEIRPWIPKIFQEQKTETSHKNNNLLHDAIESGNVKKVKIYCNQIFMFDKNGAGDYPIHLAIKSGNEEIIKLVLSNTKNINVKNGAGETALHLACKGDNPNIVKILIDSKADLDQINSKKETPRSIIEASSNPKMKEQLDFSKKNAL